MDPRKCLDAIDLYTQFAEEAAELSAAASKMARKLRQSNPTPKTLKECTDDVFEEWVDVNIAADAAGVYVRQSLYADKRERWEKRLEEKNKRTKKAKNVL